VSGVVSGYSSATDRVCALGVHRFLGDECDRRLSICSCDEYLAAEHGWRVTTRIALRLWHLGSLGQISVLALLEYCAVRDRTPAIADQHGIGYPALQRSFRKKSL
jgi:hypothetical protein